MNKPLLSLGTVYAIASAGFVAIARWPSPDSAELRSDFKIAAVQEQVAAQTSRLSPGHSIVAINDSVAEAKADQMMEQNSQMEQKVIKLTYGTATGFGLLALMALGFGVSDLRRR